MPLPHPPRFPLPTKSYPTHLTTIPRQPTLPTDQQLPPLLPHPTPMTGIRPLHHLILPPHPPVQGPQLRPGERDNLPPSSSAIPFPFHPPRATPAPNRTHHDPPFFPHLHPHAPIFERRPERIHHHDGMSHRKELPQRVIHRGGIQDRNLSAGFIGRLELQGFMIVCDFGKETPVPRRDEVRPDSGVEARGCVGSA